MSIVPDPNSNSGSSAKASPYRTNPRKKFSQREDNMLIKLINENGTNNWENIARLMPNRNARQCRERWVNYLSPDVSNHPWTAAEDLLLEQKFKEIGAKWVKISKFFKSRTDTMLKNRWLVLTRRAKKLMNKNQQPPISQELPKEPVLQAQLPLPPTDKPSKLPSLDPEKILPNIAFLPIHPKWSYKQQQVDLPPQPAPGSYH